jgi:hypothetical protein
MIGLQESPKRSPTAVHFSLACPRRLGSLSVIAWRRAGEQAIRPPRLHDVPEASMFETLLDQGRPSLADGAMGANRLEMDLISGDNPEFWNIARVIGGCCGAGRESAR